MDKILRTLETIKVPTLSGSDANLPGTIISAVVAASDSVKTKKKERISHCRSVTDAICLPSVQGLSDYHKILESVVEVLFQLSSDPDSDIRLVASECLNRLVQTLKDSQQPKLHMEIYKEIRRNQTAKSLRTALGIFAHISSNIKPQKCRAFFASLLPCFVQISKRTEEYLYENLASYYADIFKSLGPFAQDQEIKLLCKEYITNLESSSAIIRRASASILVSICQYSRKPQMFLPRLLYQVTGIIKPKLMENSVSAIIGSMQCIRHIILPLYCELLNPTPLPNTDVNNVVLQLVQVYEMCLILCNHDDHNVVTTSLETLQQLLTDPIEPLKAVLTSPSGIENSIDKDAFSTRPVRSHGGSQESELESLAFPDESPELLETDSDIPKFRSFLSSSTSDSRDLEESEIITLSRHNSDTITLEENTTDVDSNPEILHHSDDESVSKAKEVILPTFPELQIGSLYEKNVPVYYCARFLAYNFLLAGQKGYERPDSEVRISVKVLAVNCLVNLVKISLDVYFLPLSHDLVESDDEMAQKIEDICLYAIHNDPLLRGCTYVLAGYVLDNLAAQASANLPTRDLSALSSILKTGLLDSSNIGVKCAIAAVNSCLGRLWRSENLTVAEELFSTSLMVSSNPYWLVKSDLIELLANIEWNVAVTCETRKQQVLNIILEYLSDEDVRVRNTAVACLPRYINGVSITDTWNPQRSGVLCPQCIAKDINFRLDLINPPSSCALCRKPGHRTSSTLESVLEKLVLPAMTSDNKNLFVGYQAAIAHLSETHPPTLFKTAWHLKSRYSDSGMLLGLYMDLLRSSPFIYDINVHQSVLKIVCNLFLASEFYDRVTAKGRVFDEGNPFMSTNSNVCSYGTTFMQHVIAVLKLYQNIVEQSSISSSSRKISTSPVISPVKKFSQKLEAEKKASESETDKKAKGPYFSATLCPLHMKKINDSILQSWRVYRCSLDAAVAVKFTSLLSACLDALGKMFPIIRSDYPGMPALIEEILAVTNSVFSFSPTDVLKCIRKILQSVFAGYKSESPQNIQITECKPRDRFPLFLFPSQLLRFPTEEKSTVSRSSAEVTALGSFIRQFEPAVVSGLRVYTTTSDPMVQIEVLRLLKQLISGHVNYGLVDSNQVFLGFVIKQITYLEEGQIREASLLIEEMFQFLTLLSHEHHATKSFVDVPKVLNLCDILVSSEYGSRTGVKCLMPAVLDIIVKRFKTDHSNWEKKESANHSETLLRLVIKAIKYPDVLRLAYMILSGRQQRQESKWNEDSETILQNLLAALGNDTLRIHDGISFNYLVAGLCALHKDSIPPTDELITNAQRLVAEEILTKERCHSWLCSLCSYWVLIVKQSINSDMTLQADGLSGRFFIKLLVAVVDNYAKVHLSGGSTYPSVLFVQQFGVLMYSLLFLLQSECYEELKMDIHSGTTVADWKYIHSKISSLPDQEAALSLCCIDFLSGISYPHSEILELFLNLRIDPRNEFLMSALSIIMNDLNDGDIPSVEEWAILSHAQDIVNMINIPVAKTFLSRLSKFRKGQFLERLELVVSSHSMSEEIQENILTYLKLVSDEFLCEIAVLGVELLKRLTSPYLQLDASHFICSSLSQIHTRKMLFTHKDRDVIKVFIDDSAINIRYPRLTSLASAVLGDVSNDQSKPSKNVSSMLAQWCCEEITSVEGLAIAKMLSTLKFTQIMNMFSQRHFNLGVLRYCFIHMRSIYHTDTVTANDVLSLFTSESRSGLIEKWPLGVACVEFVVETLDAWENIVSDDVINEFDADKAVDFEFLNQLPLMWECLTAMLHLKKAVITNSVPEEKGCYNNFIPTKIFTISFQYILMSAEENKPSSQKDIPVQRLRTFLNFASAAFTDSSFVSFFNVRDNPQHIFICARSLRHLVEQIVKLYNIDWNYNRNNSDYYSEIDAECATVLTDFDYLMDFVFQVRCGRVKLDQSICEPLWNVISGLGRCELINGWVLISHLRWKPQASWKSQIFPPIEPIPLEILRNDHDLLLQYIFKLNVFGVASKIQFEENWVIFLSVINLYVDESFQLQIVSAGLQALSMLLQQCVTIEYTDKPYNEDLNQLASKIDEILDDVEPELCKQISFPALRATATKSISNPHGIDVNSCIRFLTDLYTQWLQNPQGKMPLLLLSEVVRSVVVLSEYFEDNAQFQWMYETLMEVYKSFEKEDEIIWPHLLYGIFYSAAKIQLEAEQVTSLVQILESAINSPFANVALTGLKCGLTYLQNYPENLPVLAVLVPYSLRLTQLDETSRDAESHAFEVWKVLLFTWIHSPQEGFGVADFEQDTLRNILTILSPINKTFVSVRLLVLKALRKKILNTELKSDVRKKITKVAFETLNTPNISIFIEALKLYTTIFYVDFYQFRNLPDPDPEILMPMAERTEILFHLLKSGTKCNNQSVSKVLSLFILDFLPPSEILNRVIAEFMAPSQTAPELLAPVLAQVFEKARRKPKETALVKEWILASLPNFLNSSDVARNMWSLTLFFIGVSSTPEVSSLLPFACLRRRTPQIQQLFIHSALDLYGTLDESRSNDFRNTILRNVDVGQESSPFTYLGELLNKAEDQKKYWEIDNCSTP